MHLKQQKVHWLTLFVRSIKRILFKRNRLDIFDLDKGGPAIDKVFVINLDRQRTRWRRFRRAARTERTHDEKRFLDYCERIPAVDGSQLDLRTRSETEVESSYDLKDHYFVDPDPRLTQAVTSGNIKVDLSPNEIAVALSHLKTWRKVVEEDIPYALVLEDDVYFEDNFPDMANEAWQELPQPGPDGPGFDFLYFSHNKTEFGLEQEPFSKSLFQPVRGLWWLSGYVISNEGARKLLEALPIYGPVDLWLNLQFSKLRVFATWQSIISQRKDWKSDNNYSILPVLARAGIHPEAVSEDHSGRKPVFAIGMNKTGTTSLHFALSSLGYRSCHFVSHEFSDETARLIDSKEPLPFDAYTDVERVLDRFRELDEQYPDAAFIMTTRDLDSWLASRSRHLKRNRMENAAGAAEHTWTDGDPQAWKLERERHHDAVQSYFKDRPNKLLVYNIVDGDGWEPLCNFLGCPVPDEVFPHVDPLIRLTNLSRNLLRKVPLAPRPSTVLEFDKLSWIERPRSWDRYVKANIGDHASRTGTFAPAYTDNFEMFAENQWRLLDTTFQHNMAQFQPHNLELTEGGGFSMQLQKEKVSRREYSSASISTRSSQLHGRFEADLKPAKADGIVTALFLFRYAPWQEIDIEFFGKDTTQMMVNVYYNPGIPGVHANEGGNGTPVLIDLGFDAADDYHRYAIEWDPEEIRWFVDDELVHVRRGATPCPIPDLPMNFYFNIWAPSTMKDLAGDLIDTQLPVTSHVRSYLFSSWTAPDTTSAAETSLASGFGFNRKERKGFARGAQL